MSFQVQGKIASAKDTQSTSSRYLALNRKYLAKGSFISVENFGGNFVDLSGSRIVV